MSHLRSPVTLTRRNINRFKYRVCAAQHCQKPDRTLKVGDVIISKNHGKSPTQTIKHYHKECYEALFLGD
jgi:hypothetical protein